MTAPEPTIFATRRRMPHPPGHVYAAFADVERLARWWGPHGFTTSVESFDFQLDGHWRYTMHGPDGGHHPNTSVFRVLVPDSRVVIEHVSPPHFTLTVTLAPDGDGTLLDWSQSFPDAALAERLRAIVVSANEQNLDRLGAVLAGLPPA